VFVPLSKQFPVVDMVLRVGGVPILANATVSESHGIKVGNAAFAQILDAVGLDVDTTADTKSNRLTVQARLKSAPTAPTTTVASRAASASSALAPLLLPTAKCKAIWDAALVVERHQQQWEGGHCVDSSEVVCVDTSAVLRVNSLRQRRALLSHNEKATTSLALLH
jgi:hypothetical protein